MIDLEIPTRQQLDDLVKGDQRLLRSLDSIFQYVDFYRNRQIIYAKNTSGGQINRASAVMYTGIDNTGSTPSFRMTMSPANASSGPRSKFLGISLDNTTDGQFGYVVSFGEITGLDTSGPNNEVWADGDILYANTTMPGFLSNSVPSIGFVLPMARVLKANATTGTIFVNGNLSEGDSFDD